MEYRIGPTAEMLSIDETTLRRYEKAGKIPKSRRTTMGFRVYSEDEIARLRTILTRIGNKCGRR